MKKAVSLLLVLILSAALCVPALAAGPQEIVVNRQVQQLGEDAYVVITLTETSVFTRAGSYEKIGQRKYDYVLHGVLQWTFAVQGVFTVDPGVSCVCTNSGYSFTPYVTSWSLSSPSSSYSGNTAAARGTVRGETTVYPSVSVSCDSNGNLY